MSDELVTIDRFLFLSDADIARATLEAAGIEAVLVDANAVRMSWSDAQAHGGVRLQVRRSDAIEASAILRSEAMRSSDITPDDFETAAIPMAVDETCRRCGSEEIFPAESRSKTLARIVVFTWLALILVDLGTCAAAAAHVTLPPRAAAAAYALAFLAAFVAFIALSASPKKRCRNCGLEWRGKARPN